MNGLSDHAAELYDIGLYYLQALQLDDDLNRQKLLNACREADLWIKLSVESSPLYEETLHTEYPSPAWNALLRIDRQINSLASRFQSNARQYGWTPLARCLLEQRLLMSAVHESGDSI